MLFITSVIFNNVFRSPWKTTFDSGFVNMSAIFLALAMCSSWIISLSINCKKKEIKEEEKDIDDAEKDEQGDDENDIITPIISHSKLLRQKKSDRKVRWNNMHHLKNKSSRMKKGVFSTSS